MKRFLVTILIVLTLTIVFLRFGRGERRQTGDYRRMTMQEAAEYMKREEGYLLLDVRTTEEYANGHIPGAICIPNETISTIQLKELPDLEQTILVYCRSGNRSRQAADKLVAIGYQNIIEIGGIQDWEGAIEK
ncbi:MAG TPA: rhodanese-like domain-containing protein [Lachnospiraceae bacterium]|nr:rhodanese-like domain-containing protein [Lachnospiraceae bacterium]HPF30132.1 rhodanese-like domain-containing protein [Lachnospiraceae bacterium]